MRVEPGQTGDVTGIEGIRTREPGKDRSRKDWEWDKVKGPEMGPEQTTGSGTETGDGGETGSGTENRG